MIYECYVYWWNIINTIKHCFSWKSQIIQQTATDSHLLKHNILWGVCEMCVTREVCVCLHTVCLLWCDLWVGSKECVWNILWHLPKILSYPFLLFSLICRWIQPILVHDIYLYCGWSCWAYSTHCCHHTSIEAQVRCHKYWLHIYIYI